jgi:hypothetical protein
VLFLMSAAAATPHTGRAFQCVTLLLVVYMGHPDLHDAIWKGWEAIAFDHRLVGRRFLALTGAYLYGLMLLHALLLLHLRRARRAEAAFHVGMPGPDEHPGSALASATDPGFHEVHSPTGHR